MTLGIIVVHARCGQHSIVRGRALPGLRQECRGAPACAPWADTSVRPYSLNAQNACSYILFTSNIVWPVNKRMNLSDLIKEIVNTYQKHGWQLRRALLRPETRNEFAAACNSLSLNAVQVEEGSVDGLWFSRASHAEREAWELRLVAENPFALFETFEKDETEEQREEMRREMEARLREYVNK
jgi:hypothetical protein